MQVPGFDLSFGVKAVANWSLDLSKAVRSSASTAIADAGRMAQSITTSVGPGTGIATAFQISDGNFYVAPVVSNRMVPVSFGTDANYAAMQIRATNATKIEALVGTAHVWKPIV